MSALRSASMMFAIALVGCAGFAMEGDEAPMARTGGDAGVGGGGADGGGPANAPPPSDDGALFADSADGLAEAATPAHCFAQPAGNVLCDEPGCEVLHSCCVGDGNCCAQLTMPGVPPTLAFASCDGDPDLEACLNRMGAGVTAFGSIAPWVDGGGFHPGGSGSDDGGLLVGSPVDARLHKIRLQATFQSPTVPCGAGCVESAAVGVTTQRVDPRASNHVRPLAALLYSGARNEMSLVVGDDVVKRWRDAGDLEWTLTLQPTGEIVVGGADTFEMRWVPPAAASIVVYGRSSNLTGAGSGSLGARLADFTATTSLCDVPSVWEMPRTIDIGSMGRPLDGTVSRLSVAEDGGERWAAVGTERGIFVAQISDPTSWQLDRVDIPDIPLGDASRDYASGGVHDPALLREPGRLVVYFTATGSGPEPKRTIGRAVREDGGEFALDPAPHLEATGELVGFEQPTVTRHENGEIVLVARAERMPELGGGHELVVFRSYGGSGLTRVDNSDLGDLTRREPETRSGAGFDADEVAWPSLVIHNGAWQLYYAGRRGTRWAIGLLASDQLTRWREPHAGPVLRGRVGFDRIGATAPAALSLADGDRVELIYLGMDGSTWTPGRTERAATNQGVPGG